MEKNNKPTGMQYGVSLALVDEISSFVRIHNLTIVEFKKNGGWIAIPEVPGTLSVTCTESDNSGSLFTITGKFRVAFDTQINQQQLDDLRPYKMILRYNTGGGKEKISGTKAYPVSLRFSTIEGFDGYECTVSGTQSYPESFINE